MLLDEGHTWDEVSEQIQCSRGFVASWSKRFAEQRIGGLYSRHLGQVATVLTPQLEVKIFDIIGLYLNPPAHAAVSASMKRRISRLWIARIRYCRCVAKRST